MPPRPTRLTNLPPELIRRIMEPADAYAVARAQAASRTVRSALRNRLAGPATPMPGAENIRASEPDASHVMVLAHRIALLHAWTDRAIEHYNRTAPRILVASIQARYRIIADYWTKTAGELRGMGRLVFTKKNGRKTTSLQEVTGTWEEDDDPPCIEVEISARSGAHDAKLKYEITFAEADGMAFLSIVSFEKVGLCTIYNGNGEIDNVRDAWSDLDLNLWSTMPQGIGGIRQVLRHVHLLKSALLVAFRQPVRMTFDPHNLPRPFDRLFKMMGILGN